MKRLMLLAVLTAFSFSGLLGGTRNSAVGSTTTAMQSGGRTIYKTETVAEKNPLPVQSSTLEAERSAPIPLSRVYDSAVRWTSNDGAAIAQDIAVNAEGSNSFVGWNLNNLRVSLFDNFSNVPNWEFASDPATYRNYVALSSDASVVAAGSYHNIYLFDKVSGSVTFNFLIPGSRTAGPIAVSRDGQLVVCATISPLAGGMHRVYAFHPPSTTPIWSYDFSDAQSTGVYGISLNANKTVVAVNGKFYAWFLNAATGAVITQMEIANTESRLAMSADAGVVGIAELSGFIKAFTFNTAQSSYNLLWQYRVPPGLFTNWASAVDVSADGLTLMAGTLIFVDGSTYDGTVYMFDTFGEGAPLWVRTGLGDEVAAVALSDDGSIGAAASWGDYNNPNKPSLLFFERNSNQPFYSVVTPGSMFAMAMSADGKTVVAGGKHVHARTFGSGGDVFNVAVDMGGGAIAGTVQLGGAPPNQSGTTVQVVGTTRTATTLPNGQYVVSNVPPGTYTVRISHLGYVGTTVTGVVVTSPDTTRNINATLAQTGAAPSNLVASHSLSSRIQLNWTNPSFLADYAFDRVKAVDEILETPGASLSAKNPKARQTPSPLFLSITAGAGSDLVPPDSIRIYRGVRSGGPYFLKKTIAGSVASYVDSSAMPLKNYYYRITGMYGTGESVYSNEAYGTVDSSFLQFSITTPHRTTTPVIDGVLSPGEWSDALQVDASDVFGYGGGVLLPRGSTFMYFKYDSVAQRLYIAGEDFLNNDGLAATEGFGLYFDDNHNRNFEPVGTDPLLREGNYWAYYFTSGSTVRFREIYTGGGVNAVVDTVFDAQTAFSNTSGHVTGEVSIPMSFFDRNHLQVYGPDKIVGAGLFMIGRNGSGGALFHGWWPQTMISVFSPSGFGNIHIPIRLLAPPRAPSNVQVARAGSRLHVTWSDPTVGLNNDPLTVPVTIQLWRNGSPWREFPAGVQSWTDSNVVAEAWYEYKIRGSVNVNSTTYFGPYSATVGEFAGASPQLTEIGYDDGIPDIFYVVDFSYNGNQFGIRFTPLAYPATVYRVKAFTNNGNKPIMVSIHADSSGFPGPALTGDHPGTTYQTAGIDSFLVTFPGAEPPVITSGSFHVVLSYLPTSPDAPGIGGDYAQPIDGRSAYFTTTSGWTAITNVDLMVRAFMTGQPTSVGNEKSLPKEFALLQNFPNPFNPATKIGYQLPARSQVSLKVFDVLGREVATLVNEEKQAGAYSALWNAHGMASGVYFYKLQAGTYTETKKLMLLR